MRPYTLLAVALVSLVTALYLAVLAPHAQPCYGLTKDMAYLITIALAAWLMIAGAAIGYVALITAPYTDQRP